MNVPDRYHNIYHSLDVCTRVSCQIPPTVDILCWLYSLDVGIRVADLTTDNVFRSWTDGVFQHRQRHRHFLCGFPAPLPHPSSFQILQFRQTRKVNLPKIRISYSENDAGKYRRLFQICTLLIHCWPPSLWFHHKSSPGFVWYKRDSGAIWYYCISGDGFWSSLWVQGRQFWHNGSLI